MRLNKAEQHVLAALVSGRHLKSHRYLDGTKLYALHNAANTEREPVAAATVDSLRARGLIVGNMKFPAATYLLTPRGADVASALTENPLKPLLSRLFRSTTSAP